MSKPGGKWKWICIACLVLIVGFVAFRLTQPPIAVPLDSAGKTPDAMARAWFGALSTGDVNSINQLGGGALWAKPETRQSYEGLQVVSIGTPFHRSPLPQWFVPYEIRLKSGEVKKFNLAVRNDYPDKKWRFDGGL